MRLKMTECVSEQLSCSLKPPVKIERWLSPLQQRHQVSFCLCRHKGFTFFNLMFFYMNCCLRVRWQLLNAALTTFPLCSLYRDLFSWQSLSIIHLYFLTPMSVGIYLFLFLTVCHFSRPLPLPLLLTSPEAMFRRQLKSNVLHISVI